MPESLHKLALFGKCKELTERLKAGADVNEESAFGSPLYYALDTYEPTIDQYRAIILLLEAGAKPLQPQPGNSLWEVRYPLLAALEEKHLAKVLLLLWYINITEDYKTITVVSAEDNRRSTTLQHYIETTGRIETEEGKHRDYVRWINETAADAKQVKELSAEAKRCLAITPPTIDNYRTAIRHYQKAAQIYQKHADLEDSIVYFPASLMDDDSATPQKLHRLFKEYYRQKKFDCLTEASNCYQLAKEKLTELDEDSVKHHIEIINQLIELSKILAKETDRRFYLKRAAEVMVLLPDRRASEATTVSDEDVAVSIEEDEENERASLLGTKPTDTSSFFGALRRRRVPAAATQVSQHSHASTLKA